MVRHPHTGRCTPCPERHFYNSFDGIFRRGYISNVKWEVEYTDAFGQWWAGLSDQEQISLAASVQLLEERGPSLGFPHSSGINGSKHHHMRELRTQHLGRHLEQLRKEGKTNG